MPFELNIGDAPLTRDQQAHLIDVIYNHMEVFSLFDGDLGFCDVLKHSIPTTTDKPVYLPHRQIPVQLQSEVRKCLDNWLKQGIIRPSKSTYASQVVIVRKKTGEIRLCVNFRKLNAISIRDSFPLPRVEEALQAVQAAVWFSSFDLAQMAMEEKGDDNEIRVITYASRSLRPSEKSMRDYSSAKIELMALKWSVCDKFKDYLLGSKFTVFTDNNPLCYIKSSKLGAAQIRWLSELALYDSDIVYRTGKSNLVADALSRRPEVEEEIEKEVLPESDDEEWIAVSYQVEEQGGHVSSMEFNQVISELVGGTKIDKKLKDRIQITDVAKEKLNGNTIEVATGMVSLFDSITPEEMA